ncbi:ABC transporter ATP-binding protein [bacterium]|nr:ABC transporter ATP-binding protein [bacterium]
MDILSVENIRKSFRNNFSFGKYEVLHDVSFFAGEGEILGFLGPNGAGKTTIIKIIMGLIKPDSGSVRILGGPVSDRETKRVIGFLPENPFFYPHLTLGEFLIFCAKMSGMKGKSLGSRIESVIEQVGLAGQKEKRLSGFSKGMTQRAGLAQAVLHDPDLLILDEPFSGLDPLGRKIIRDFLLELKARGKTIFFSSHILSDMEALCDSAYIIREGVIVRHVGLDEVFKMGEGKVEITARGYPLGLDGEIGKFINSEERLGGETFIVVNRQEYVRSVIQHLLNNGADILKVVGVKSTLEEIFVNEIGLQVTESKNGFMGKKKVAERKEKIWQG